MPVATETETETETETTETETTETETETTETDGLTTVRPSTTTGSMPARDGVLQTLAAVLASKPVC